MATVYLHIGLTKTASSSIQSFLAGNRDVLDQHGIAYPDFGYPLPNKTSKKNARFLIEPAIDKDGEKCYDIPSAHYLDGLDRVADLGQTFERIILSDEGIWRHSLRREGFWPTLKQDLDERALDVCLIVYLRRQDQWLQSHWRQNIKEGLSDKSFQEFLDDAAQSGFPYDFGAYLDTLADTFGKEAICVRVYEKGQFKGLEGSIYSDFLDIFGLTCEGFTIGQEYRNLSMQGNALEIQRILNERKDLHFNKCQVLKRPLMELPVKEKTTLFASAADQRAFLAGLEESNSHVAREYLGREDGVLFHEQVEDLPAQVFDNESLLHDTIQVFGQAVRTLERQNKHLKQEIEDLKEAAAGTKKGRGRSKKR